METLGGDSRRALNWALRVAVFLMFAMGGCPDGRAQPVGADGLYSQPFVVLDPGAHTAPIGRADIDSRQRFIVTGSDDKSVRVWSAVDGSLLRTIRLPQGPGHVGKAYAAAISPDGSTIAAGGMTLGSGQEVSIYLFDRATGEEVGRIDGLPNAVLHLAYSPDGTRLVAALWARGVRLYDVSTRRQIAADADYGGSSYWAAFDRVGRIATASDDGKVRLYDPGLKLLANVAAPGGKEPFSVAFSPDGTRLAVGYNDTLRVDVLDGTTLAALLAPDTTGAGNGNLSQVAWSRDGRTLLASGELGKGDKALLRAWEAGGRGLFMDNPVANDTVMSLLPLPGRRLVVASQDPRLAMLNAAGQTLWAVDPKIATFSYQYETFKVSAEGSVVQFGYLRGGGGPARFDLSSRRIDLDPPADPRLQAARTDGLNIAWRNTYEPTLDGKRLDHEPSEFFRRLAIADDKSGFVLGSEWNLRRFSRSGDLVWQVETPSVAWAVALSGDGRLVVAGYGDGTIRWYRWSDGAEVLAFFPHADRKRWVAWTPSGYYAASPGAEDLIRWQINRGPDQVPEVYTASRFREHFYRPDVVARVLQMLDVDQAVALADREAGGRASRRKTSPRTPRRAWPSSTRPRGPAPTGPRSRLATAFSTVRVRRSGGCG